jgi:cholesterol transport system auxiliary component
MAYLLRPHEVRYYAHNQWADAPGRMLAPLLGQALERSGIWRAVVRMSGPLRGDYRLDADDLVLQQEFFSTPSLVRLTLRLQLTELKGSRILGTRSFEIQEQATSDDAYGGVLAANRAVTKLLDQASAWLRACMSERSPRGC